MHIAGADRQKMDGRIQGMLLDRYSWWGHWAELAAFLLPRRYTWLITPNQLSRGSRINQNIIDPTATLAARTCASGMLSGVTSPARQWFKLNIEGFPANDQTNPVSLWLSEVEKRMLRVFSDSNFYTGMGVLMLDLVVFGTAAMIIDEDYDDVICCHNPALGEFFLANDQKGVAGTFAREYVQTILQLCETFGKENLPKPEQEAYERGGVNLRLERTVRHLIEKNEPPAYGIAKTFAYRQMFWLKGSTETELLGIRGCHEAPGVYPRWDLSGNDAYGRSPGMDALGSVKQLQQEQRRKAQAIDKMVNPPMVADVQLKNQPASGLPGGLTYVSGTNNVGYKPAYEVNPRLQEMMMDIESVQNTIKSIFFTDLFMMISQLNTVRSATEIDARREEKLIALGPVLERLQVECLDVVITRVFNIMNRGGLLPPPPPEIGGVALDIDYVSMLAEAQRASSSAGLERLFGLAGNLAAVHPDVLDNIDFDEGLTEYASQLGVDPKVIKEKSQVDAIRMERAKQQQQQQQLEMTVAAAKGAKTLSETQVGAGQNALSAMMGSPV